VSNLSETQPTVGELIESLAPERLPDAADVAAARQRLEWRRATTERPRRLPRVPTSWRVAGGAIAAAVALSVIIAFTPQGSSTAAAFLAQFRSQQVSAIAVTPQSQADILKSVNALGNLGTIQTPDGTTQPEALARQSAARSRIVTLAEATESVGFPLATPDPATLPADVSKTPTVKVSPATQIRFTFDKAKAQAYYQSTGRPEVSMPDKFNGATLSISIPSAALLSYGAGGASKDELLVGEAGELVVDVQGNVSLPEMRDFLLGLPGLPTAVVSQLRQIQDWNETLPIPVPIDQINWKSTTINGNHWLLLDDNSGVGSAAVWHADGRLYGVAGTLKSDSVRRVAESLAVR
jgi:hypothetical protein